jgi:hypothetical protein
MWDGFFMLLLLCLVMATAYVPWKDCDTLEPILTTAIDLYWPVCYHYPLRSRKNSCALSPLLELVSWSEHRLSSSSLKESRRYTARVGVVMGTTGGTCRSKRPHDTSFIWALLPR